MAKMDAQSFEHLANVLGDHAAGEVLLLLVGNLVHHFSRENFHEHNMEISFYDVVCKFKKVPKYNVKLRKPNAFDLEWVYSVPWGETDCESWVFIDTSTAPSWGPDAKAWIQNYISEIGWAQIVNRDNRRFLCPSCSTPHPRVRI